MKFNQNSYLVKFWAERKYYKNEEVPDLFNLQEQVDIYISNNLVQSEQDSI